MKLKPGRLTIPKELAELRRINVRLPFADPIARVIPWGGKELVVVAGSWRVDFRRQRAFKRLRRFEDKHNMYDDF